MTHTVEHLMGLADAYAVEVADAPHPSPSFMHRAISVELIGKRRATLLAALQEQAAELEQVKAENERLTACLQKANENHEEFERKWYLACDERDALQAKLDALASQEPVGQVWVGDARTGSWKAAYLAAGAQPQPVNVALSKLSTESLPPEFIKVLHDNAWELYSRTDSAQAKAQPAQPLELSDDAVHRAMAAINTASMGDIQPTFEEMQAALAAANKKRGG